MHMISMLSFCCGGFETGSLCSPGLELMKMCLPLTPESFNFISEVICLHSCFLFHFLAVSIDFRFIIDLKNQTLKHLFGLAF